MNIFLKYLNGDIVSIQTSQNTSFKTLKDNISKYYIKLFFKNEEVDYEKTLEDYSVKENDIILVFLDKTSIPLDCLVFDKGNTDSIKLLFEPIGNYGKVDLPLDRTSEWSIEMSELKHSVIGIVNSRIVEEENFLPKDFKGLIYKRNPLLSYNGEYLFIESRYDYSELSKTPEIGDKWFFEFNPFEKYLRIYDNKEENYKMYFEDKHTQFWLYVSFHKYPSFIIKDI